MSIIGSVLSDFSRLTLSTADDKYYTLKNGFVSRLALRCVGIPHLGFRARARIILREARHSMYQDSKILDAGCGYGIYSLTLAKREKGHIDAIDIDRDRIDTLKSMLVERPYFKEKIDLFNGSLTALPFADNSYDLIICSDVIEHIGDDSLAIRELFRVLKPGGRLIISTPYDSKRERKIYRKFGHERAGYTKEMFAKLFESAGLKIEKDYYYEYYFGTILFDIFNTITWKPLMGLLFYQFYLLYLLDSSLKIGEPNGIIVVARKV